MMARSLVMMGVLFFSLGPVWSQNGGTQSGGTQNGGAQNAQNGAPPEGAADQGDDAQMAAPPSAGGMAFPARTGSEERSNYLSIGLVAGVGYDTNVYYGEGIAPEADETYSILPTVQIDRTSERLHENLSYNPGFLFYQQATALNEVSENATGEVDYRVSPHSNVSVYDSFLKTSNVFSQPYSLSGGTISGSPGTPGALALAPYADQILNHGGGLYSYQFSRNAMFGVGGGASELDYPNSGEAVGLYNANTYSGNAFYNLRLTPRQYLGATVDYFNVTESAAKAGGGQTQTVAVLPFYTFYPRKNIFLTVSGGPQYYTATFEPAPPVKGWSPTVMASAHAEVERAAFSASYQRTVTAGGGLLGVFTTNSGSAEFRLQLSRTWGMGCSGSYASTAADNAGQAGITAVAGENGHVVRAAGSLSHILSPRVSAEVGYDYLRQDYAGIPAVANAPNTQRVYGTIQYQLRRPLGR